jgi:hypothetical protein
MSVYSSICLADGFPAPCPAIDSERAAPLEPALSEVEGPPSTAGTPNLGLKTFFHSLLLILVTHNLDRGYGRSKIISCSRQLNHESKSPAPAPRFTRGFARFAHEASPRFPIFSV